MMSAIFILIGVVIFLKLKRFHQFIIFSLSALFPFTFGNFGSIPDFLVIEWLTIITFLILLHELNPLNSLEKKLKIIKFRGIGLFIGAILILIIWSIVSVINNEIINPIIMIGKTTGIRRTYFAIFNNILLFFTTILFFSTQYPKFEIRKFFKIVLYITLIIGFVRIYTFYYHLNTPFLTNLFQYNSDMMISKTGISYRFSGLDYAATIGIPALCCSYIYRNKLNVFILLLLILFVFLSGGRTVMMGAIFSIIIFSFLFLPKNFIYLTVAIGLLFFIGIVFLPQSFLEGQMSRLTTLEEKGGYLGQDPWRGMAWYLFFKNFASNPLFGKGITDYTGFIYSTLPGTEEFARQQLFAGGHGAYFSLLSTFGVGGITYFIIMVWGGAFLALKKIKKYLAHDQDKTAVALFCFILLIIFSIDCITGHNGLDVPFLFYAVGLICSLRVIENNPAVTINENNN